METKFTLKSQRFLAAFILLAGLSFSSNTFAKVYTVAVSNYKFDPKEITIKVGDTVKWVNPDGHHNVNGQKSVYPSNPVSFGNAVGMGWTYQFIFDTAGTYDYQCDPHTFFGMFGKVTVTQSSPTSVQIAEAKSEKINLFPNPAKEYISVSIPKSFGTTQILNIYNIAGALIDSKTVAGNSVKYDLGKLKNGVYFVGVQSQEKKQVLKFIKE